MRSARAGKAPGRDREHAQRGRLFLRGSVRTICGAPITKASSCWETSDTAIHSSVTDHASRYLLLCEAMRIVNAEKPALTAFERLFRERGYAAGDPLGQWCSVRFTQWLVQSVEDFGVVVAIGHQHRAYKARAIRSRTGGIERMHLTLKKEATRPAGGNILQQQAKFDDFIEEFNNERPHEALEMKCPAQIYTASPRPYQGILEQHYPFHDKTVMVTSCGRLCLYRKKINLSRSLAGQAVGVKEVESGIWLVSFMDYDFGYIDLEEKTAAAPRIPSGQKCYLCRRNEVLPMCPVRTMTRW